MASSEGASSSPSLSLTVKVMVSLASLGCAEAWLWLGSIDLNLTDAVSTLTLRANDQSNALSAQEISEVGDGVIGIPDQEGLGLGAVVFIAINVGQDRRYLSVYWSSG